MLSRSLVAQVRSTSALVYAASTLDRALLPIICTAGERQSGLLQFPHRLRSRRARCRRGSLTVRRCSRCCGSPRRAPAFHGGAAPDPNIYNPRSRLGRQHGDWWRRRQRNYLPSTNPRWRGGGAAGQDRLGADHASGESRGHPLGCKNASVSREIGLCKHTHIAFLQSRLDRVRGSPADSSPSKLAGVVAAASRAAAASNASV